MTYKLINFKRIWYLANFYLSHFCRSPEDMSFTVKQYNNNIYFWVFVSLISVTLNFSNFIQQRLCIRILAEENIIFTQTLYHVRRINACFDVHKHYKDPSFMSQTVNTLSPPLRSCENNLKQFLSILYSLTVNMEMAEGTKGHVFLTCVNSFRFEL